uniref:Uncharacterized protein n=1 Tax=Cryptomonas curvata TaxID=233186 RepID=A0A7S0MNU4_9CRYP|mmetsp:Transcript_47582/g.99557  ORF Transcript_47582/g.99557 Transcript_47582/m.99557 type:complete len:239 (+) Transcript_47582:25-741(+)
MNRISGTEMRKWTNAWSSWSGKASESSLHLDDIHDERKEASHDIATNGFYQEASRSHSEQQSAESFVKLSSFDISIKNQKIQEHIARLHDFSDLCERANQPSSPADELPPGQHGWARRFKDSKTRLLSGSEPSLASRSPPTPHGSFLVPRAAFATRLHISPPRRPQSSHTSSFCRPRSCPTTEATVRPLSNSADGDSRKSGSKSGSKSGGAGGGPADDSAVYRRQVAAALEVGRTVWL